MKAVLAVIGGSGVGGIEALKNPRSYPRANINTPFGYPSGNIVKGELEGLTVFFLPRHGEGHTLLPSEIPNQANIYALKMLRVTHVLGLASVGSLKHAIRPGTFVVVDQFLDLTCPALRPSTFFGQGIVGHVGFADPVCQELAGDVFASSPPGEVIRRTGTLAVMEGPAFSTKAESARNSTNGADLIGMTSLPEAKLAREAELHYAALALVSDYDCGMNDQGVVSVPEVQRVVATMIGKAQQIIVELAKTLCARVRLGCACATALDTAIQTKPEDITDEARGRMGILLDRVLAPK